MKKSIILVLITVSLVGLALLPEIQAVLPAPDGGYGPPDYGTGNTAEGEEALLNLSSGGFNTAAGFRTLFSNTTGNFNTAIGAGALFNNTGDQNTATGAGALLSNTSGRFNTANGEAALFYARHHGTGIKRKLVADAVEEMIAAKTRKGVSDVYLADLQSGLARSPGRSNAT